MSEFDQGCVAAANTIFAFLNRSGHQQAAALALAAWRDGSIVQAVAVPVPAADPTGMAPTPSPAEFARSQGYTGDQCTHCNSMRMKTAGHCMVCEDCGTTTGCS